MRATHSTESGLNWQKSQNRSTALAHSLKPTVIKANKQYLSEPTMQSNKLTNKYIDIFLYHKSAYTI